MKTISVFVAGAKNLQPLRLRLKAMANDMNNEFKQKGLNTFVNMVSYENYGDEQSIYNKFIAEEADMVLFLLDDRIGEKTEEEYRLAVECNEKKGRPEHCVFLREFDEKTPEIEHIEELMRSTSNKYYVSYGNPDDLMAKAKARILDLAEKKKNSLGVTSSKREGKGRRLLLVLGILLALFVAARFAMGPLKTSFVFFKFEFPKSLEQNGINDIYVEQQLMLTMNNEVAEAQKKLNFILNDTVLDTPVWTIAFPKKIKAGRENRLRNALRSMMGCHDIHADLHFIESGNTITNNFFFTDWNDKVYHYTTDDDVTTALRKDAAYLSLPFNPVVSTLYDYHFIDELLVYKMVSPWKNEAFQAVEREVVLKEFAQSGQPNAMMANLLLGHYYESLGLENGFDKTSLENAIGYYAPLLDDPFVGKMISEKTDYLKSTIMASGNPVGSNLVAELEQKGAFTLGDCQQLVIVGDEDTIMYKYKKRYNATLYAFEKGPDGSWNQVFEPYTVHLGVHGFATPEEKKEGDLKTPTGYYAMPFAFGKKNDLNTKLEFMEVGPKHVWVSDVASPEYNKIVVDEDGSYTNNKNEKLFRSDHLYDYAIVIDYNMEARVHGKGSAIFIHIEREENHGTAGCVSMSREEIVRLIEWLDGSKHPHIYLTKKLK